jgi:hypothetical protein
MTLSPPTNNHPDTHTSCQFAAGNDQARLDLLDWPAVAPQIPSRKVQFVPPPPRAHPTLALTPSSHPPVCIFLKYPATAKSP